MSVAVQPFSAPLRLDVHLTPADRAAGLRADVETGLRASPKELPPKWFYDERGSLLFDAITRLPEYYPTRRETAILRRRAAEIAAVSGADTLVELGSGTSEKTTFLLDALAGRGRLQRYVAMDVCEEMLLASAERLQAAYRGLHLHCVVGDFERHLPLLPRGGRRLVAFLGSTIGNLVPAARAAFLADLRGALADGDALLLGADLVKDADRLVAAYDDAAGVTAQFNRNVLAVLNRELGGTFALDGFDHLARFDAGNGWIEMLLRANRDQTVVLRDLDLVVQFARGELMRTEISTKFRRETLERELRLAGFELARWWTDPLRDYSLSLAIAGSGASCNAAAAA